MRQALKALLPYGLRNRLRSLRFYDRLQSRHLALTSKRIDLCAAQFAHVLSLANHPPLKGKVCLELGCGWVLSHALVCYLLGAEKVIATDIVGQAFPRSLGLAVRNAIPSIPQDILSPFEEHAQLRDRFERLLAVPRFDLTTLHDLGIEYVSPIDFSRQTLPERVDFIYSISVLEHVPCPDVVPMLRNLVSMLSDGGTMIHCFHLEDHKDLAKHPFDFLSIPAEQFPPAAQSERGNRLRHSVWSETFDDLPSSTTSFLYSWSRDDKPLPTVIDSSIKHVDEADLRVSHLGAYTRKCV